MHDEITGKMKMLRVGFVMLGFCVLLTIVPLSLPQTAQPGRSATSTVVLKTNIVDENVPNDMLSENNTVESPAYRSPPPSSPTPRSRNLTLVVELKGELCNHLSSLAGAYLTKLRIEQQIPYVQVHMVGQHQAHVKWTRGASDLKRCLPVFQKFRFDGGTWDTQSNFQEIQDQQTAWLGDNQSKLSNIRHKRDIEYLRGLLEQQEDAQSDTNSTEQIPTPVDATDSTDSTITRYSLPYLKANQFITFSVLDDPHNYDKIRAWYAWNETACCRRKADPEDRVYHFRNFLTELGKEQSFERNFVELSPERTAHHLFGPALTALALNSSQSNLVAAHTSKESILIISRYPENLGPFSDALSAVGYNVSLPPAQTGVEDFCLLMSARRELVGSIRSTYTRWAAILGNATLNRLFTVRRNPDESSFGTNWTKGRVQRLDDGRVFHWDTYYQPESYSLDESSGIQGKRREKQQWEDSAKQ